MSLSYAVVPNPRSCFWRDSNPLPALLLFLKGLAFALFGIYQNVRQ